MTQQVFGSTADKNSLQNRAGFRTSSDTKQNEHKLIKTVLEQLEYLSDTDDNNDDDCIRNPVDVRPRRRRWDGHCEHRLEKIFRKRCDAAELV